MKFRDALLAGPEHGADRLPAEIDRRLRRRLGLDAPASTRRVWLRPAIATFAIAGIALAVIHYRPTQPTEPAQRAAIAFVDISKARWSGTVTGNELDVRADSPASATVAWVNAAVVAAPGTRLTTTSASSLVLAHGAIQVQRTDATPMLVDVPMGHVVIAAYRSSVTVHRESVTILINDGTGHYVDADERHHALVPNAPLVWPPTTDTQRERTGRLPDASAPAAVQPSRKRANGRASVAPAPAPAPTSSPEQEAPAGATTPSVPRAADVPCTFKSDCDPGSTCRKNENGASVCMGNGGEGAACWFDSDCVTQHCIQRRCGRSP